MQTASFEYICDVVRRTNILPIISGCNVKCIFCSHKNNPKDILTYRVPKLDLSQVEQLMEYLSTDKKIVIGDSASRIVEGEPFLYKDFMYILNKIRAKYKVTPIQITTNGSFLTEDIVSQLAELEPIEINISLNSSSPKNRGILLNDKNSDVSINGCKLLNKYNINYNGSLVLMPDIVGWGDIEDTITFLCENNAEIVRLFIPGVTKYAIDNYNFEEISSAAEDLVEKIRVNYTTPIVIEPPLLDNLNAKIEGVIKNSPSYNSGLRYGDIIKSVNGEKVKCRVDAFKKVAKEANPQVEYQRNDKIYEVIIKKDVKSTSGLVFLYDIDPNICYDINRLINRHKAVRAVVITSQLGYNCLKELLEKEISKQIEICEIKNDFFGGSIRAAGLLTVKDIVEQIKEKLDFYKPDLLIIPEVMFDHKGEDLRGDHFNKIREATGLNIEVI